MIKKIIVWFFGAEMPFPRKCKCEICTAFDRGLKGVRKANNWLAICPNGQIIKKTSCLRDMRKYFRGQ